MRNKLFIKNNKGKKLEVFMKVSSSKDHGKFVLLLFKKETGELYLDLSKFIIKFNNNLYMVIDSNAHVLIDDFINNNHLGHFMGYTSIKNLNYPTYHLNIKELSKFDVNFNQFDY